MLNGLFVSIMTFLMSSLRSLHRCLNNSLRDSMDGGIYSTSSYLKKQPCGNKYEPLLS